MTLALLSLRLRELITRLQARAARVFGMRSGRIFSLASLSSSSVAAFRGSNSDRRNEVYFAAPQQAREIIAPEALHSHAAFLNIRGDSPSEGDGCMNGTDHPIRHFSVHLRIFGRVRNRRGCTGHDDQFGRGQNTGLGWSPPFCARFRAQSNSCASTRSLPQRS